LFIKFVILLFFQGDVLLMRNVIVKDNEYFDISPMHFGYEKCIPGHYFGPAVRTYWLIHYVVSGSGIYQIGDKTYKVKEGEMFVIEPFVETYYEADSITPWSYIWVGFTSRSNLPCRLSDVIMCPEAEKIFHQMKLCEKFSSGRTQYLSARLWDLFALLSEKENFSHTDPVSEALDYIHSEYMYGITVNELAQRLHLERTYFSVIFKKKTGVSPKQYLLSYRMEAAASLLKKGSINVSVAAHSVGYPDLYNFSKMFKRYFGVSPTQYAKTTEM